MMVVEPNFNGELLKSGGPGAEEEWERLWTYLLYLEEDFDLDMARCPLERACKIVLEKRGRGNELDDFIGKIIERYQKRYREQLLFKEYDPTKGGVVQFLCSGTYIYRIYQEYNRENGNRPYGKPVSENISGTESNNQGSNDLESDYIEQDNSEFVGQPIEEYLSRLIKQVFLKKSPQKKEGRCREHAGLQLYPWIVKAEEEYRDILNQVLCLVSKTQFITIDQSKECIEREHKEAYKSLENKILEFDDEIRNFDTKRMKLIRERDWSEKQIAELEQQGADWEQINKIKVEIERKDTDIKRKNVSIEDAYRRSSDCRFRKIFAPLSEENIIKLCNFKRCNAAQNISRYKKLIKDLIARTAGEERLNIMQRLGYL